MEVPGSKETVVCSRSNDVGTRAKYMYEGGTGSANLARVVVVTRIIKEKTNSNILPPFKASSILVSTPFRIHSALLTMEWTASWTAITMYFNNIIDGYD